MNNKKCILFDFGGTLDTDGVHWSVKYSQVLEKHGLVFTSDSFSKAFIKSDAYLLEISAEIKDYKSLLKTQIEYIVNELTDNDILKNKKLGEKILYDIWNDVSSCLNNSKSTLFSLLHDYDIGLVSNFYGNLFEICRDLNFTNYFKVIIDSKKSGIEKPHSGIFSLALNKLHIVPEKVWVVGDSYDRDIVPSKILGCNTIWLKNKSLNNIGNYESADFIIGTINEIKKIL